MAVQYDHPVWYPLSLKLAAGVFVLVLLPVTCYLFSCWCVIAVEVRSNQALAKARAAHQQSETKIWADVEHEYDEAVAADPVRVDTEGYIKAGWETLPQAGAIYREWREAPELVQGASVSRDLWAPPESVLFVYAPGWYAKPARLRSYIGAPAIYTITLVLSWLFMRQRYKVWVLEDKLARFEHKRLPPSDSAEPTKACPYCGGRLPLYAEACRHCKRVLA